MTDKTAEALAALKQYGSRKAAAAALGLSKSSFRKRIMRGGASVAEQVTTPKQKQVNPVKSLADFQQTYDKDTIIPACIREAIAALDGGWVYESEFVRMANVSFADLSVYRDAFAEHIVFIKRDSKRVWAATPELAEQMRRML